MDGLNQITKKKNHVISLTKLSSPTPSLPAQLNVPQTAEPLGVGFSAPSGWRRLPTAAQCAAARRRLTTLAPGW